MISLRRVLNLLASGAQATAHTALHLTSDVLGLHVRRKGRWMLTALAFASQTEVPEVMRARIAPGQACFTLVTARFFY